VKLVREAVEHSGSAHFDRFLEGSFDAFSFRAEVKEDDQVPAYPTIPRNRPLVDLVMKPSDVAVPDCTRDVVGLTILFAATVPVIVAVGMEKRVVGVTEEPVLTTSRMATVLPVFAKVSEPTWVKTRRPGVK
jgi:hypothetical protein